MSEWKVKKGNTSVQDMAIYDKEGDLVTNLDTAISIKFQVKETKKGIAKIAKTETDGITINSPLPGWIRVWLNPTETDLIVREYVMAVQLEWSATERYEARIYIDNEETDKFVIEQDIIQ